jgi:serine/threonine protein kinase
MQSRSPAKPKNYSLTFAFCAKFNEKYKILRKIGKGHSANVFEVEHKSSKERFALKAYNHMRPQSSLIRQESFKTRDPDSDAVQREFQKRGTVGSSGAGRDIRGRKRDPDGSGHHAGRSH